MRRTPLNGPWLEQVIFALDRWLRQRQAIYEYTCNPTCLFRIQRGCATERLLLADGTEICSHDPVLNIHLWNEHMPVMGDRGPTLAWARELSCGLDTSLRELALHLGRRPDLKDIRALRADMRLSSSKQMRQLARISGRYGFERLVTYEVRPWACLREFGENILLLLLVLATNPVALRSAAFWREHAVIHLSRAILEARYGLPSSQPVSIDHRLTFATR
jgi:hypothetical protein